VTDHGNGSYTLACPGSDPVLIENGLDGADGDVCTVTPSGDDFILDCPTTQVIIHNGQDGADGAPGQDGQDGADGQTCSVSDNGDGSCTLSCSDGTLAV
jgi:hypothetical protein